MSKTNAQLLADFHAVFDPAPEGLRDGLLSRRMAYLAEEVREVAEASDALQAASPEHERAAKAALIKELCDVLYVTYGTLHQLDVNADAAFAEVHRSNMSKTPNPHGKALKGPGYHVADMESLV
jgi:predicted HAD superfamily Cof-like phosphohydrolase